MIFMFRFNFYFMVVNQILIICELILIITKINSLTSWLSKSTIKKKEVNGDFWTMFFKFLDSLPYLIFQCFILFLCFDFPSKSRVYIYLIERYLSYIIFSSNTLFRSVSKPILQSCWNFKRHIIIILVAQVINNKALRINDPSSTITKVSLLVLQQITNFFCFNLNIVIFIISMHVRTLILYQL